MPGRVRQTGGPWRSGRRRRPWCPEPPARPARPPTPTPRESPPAGPGGSTRRAASSSRTRRVSRATALRYTETVSVVCLPGLSSLRRIPDGEGDDQTTHDPRGGIRPRRKGLERVVDPHQPGEELGAEAGAGARPHRRVEMAHPRAAGDGTQDANGLGPRGALRPFERSVCAVGRCRMRRTRTRCEVAEATVREAPRDSQDNRTDGPAEVHAGVNSAYSAERFVQGAAKYFVGSSSPNCPAHYSGCTRVVCGVSLAACA